MGEAAHPLPPSGTQLQSAEHLASSFCLFVRHGETHKNKKKREKGKMRERCRTMGASKGKTGKDERSSGHVALLVSLSGFAGKIQRSMCCLTQMLHEVNCLCPETSLSQSNKTKQERAQNHFMAVAVCSSLVFWAVSCNCCCLLMSPRLLLAACRCYCCCHRRWCHCCSGASPVGYVLLLYCLPPTT